MAAITKASERRTLSIIYWVEGCDEIKGEWIRLANRDYRHLDDAMTDASDSAYNDAARYRVVAVNTALVREFEPGPKHDPSL